MGVSRENSNYWSVLLAMANRNGMTAADICRKNGWSTGYIAANKARNSAPLIDNAMRMLNACDCGLYAIPKDEHGNMRICDAMEICVEVCAVDDEVNT